MEYDYMASEAHNFQSIKQICLNLEVGRRFKVLARKEVANGKKKLRMAWGEKAKKEKKREERKGEEKKKRK